MRNDYDVAVVGLGSAGAAVAGRAARGGLKVIGIDRRPLDEAGARWVNGVAGWMFDEASIARPRGDESVGHEKAFHLVAGWGPTRVVVRDHGVIGVDMRKLVARLQKDAREAGATLRGGVSLHGFDGRELVTSEGPIRARWYVDASGLAGARLLSQPRVLPRDMCAAAQEMRAVVDPGAARAFFARHEVEPGDTLCFTGIAGGFSILNVRLDGDRVSLLTGSVAAQGFPSGARILADFAREQQAWIGETIFGGSRAIPLRVPYATLGSDRVALVGDAACQMFSAHGSGVGIGLIAARMLADALIDGGGPQAYSRAFHARWGGLLVGYDTFRRFSQAMRPGELARMMRAGLLDPTSARTGLEQRMPELTASLVLGRLFAATKAPRTAARFARTLARMGAATALARVGGALPIVGQIAGR
jgi:flavin-dependent dehydrogenase